MYISFFFVLIIGINLILLGSSGKTAEIFIQDDFDNQDKWIPVQDNPTLKDKMVIFPNGGAFTSVCTKNRKALEFDSKNDYVEIPFSDTLNITEEITIEVWVKPTKDYVDEPNAWYYFVFKSGYVWELGWQGWGDSISLKLIPAGKAAVSTDCKMSMNKGEWHHVAGVKRGSFLGVYVNGEKCSSIDSFPGNIASQSTQITMNFAHQDAEHTGFAGVLDEVAIFNRALAEKEIHTTMKGILKSHLVEPLGKLTTTWGNIKVQY